MTAVEFFVQGDPVTQGSKNSFQHRHTGRVVTIESRHRELQAWRRVIGMRWKQARVEPVIGPVTIDLWFLLPRPKSHYGTGRNAGTIKPSKALEVPAVKPDADKLTRAVFDALTQVGAIEDDARIIGYSTNKRYAAAPHQAGVRITITPWKG